jgi:hypothetical protein
MALYYFISIKKKQMKFTVSVVLFLVVLVAADETNVPETKKNDIEQIRNEVLANIERLKNETFIRKILTEAFYNAPGTEKIFDFVQNIISNKNIDQNIFTENEQKVKVENKQTTFTGFIVFITLFTNIVTFLCVLFIFIYPKVLLITLPILAFVWMQWNNYSVIWYFLLGVMCSFVHGKL